MTNTNELRIGNLVQHNGTELRVVSIFEGAIVATGIVDGFARHLLTRQIEPIPLAYGLLEKLGFVCDDNYQFGNKENPLWLERYSGGYRIVRPDFCKRVVKTLHDLQNLHYALFESELNISL